MTRPRGRRSLHEAPHKLDEDIYEEPAISTPRAGVRRSLNESAHKLGRWSVPLTPVPEEVRPCPTVQAADAEQRDVVAKRKFSPVGAQFARVC